MTATPCPRPPPKKKKTLQKYNVILDWILYQKKKEKIKAAKKGDASETIMAPSQKIDRLQVVKCTQEQQRYPCTELLII